MGGSRRMRRGLLLGVVALAILLVVGVAARVAVDRNHSTDKASRRGLLVETVSEYKNVETVAGGSGRGSVATKLDYPRGVAVDADDKVYVADTANNRVQLWVPGATEGVTVAGGNGKGSEPNQLDSPRDVAVDASGNIYIADWNNHRVQKWVARCSSACSGVTVAGGTVPGSAANLLQYPTGVALDAARNLYVADTANNRVQKWVPDATSGVTVAGGNGQGAAANQLNTPSGVALDIAGNIYVADAANYRVQKWALNATSGVTVAGGNGYGSAANQLSAANGVAVDEAQNVYVADYNNNRVQRWAPNTTSGVQVAGGTAYGSAANQLNFPSKVAVSILDKNLYVADYGNHRVQKWSP